MDDVVAIGQRHISPLVEPAMRIRYHPNNRHKVSITLVRHRRTVPHFILAESQLAKDVEIMRGDGVLFCPLLHYNGIRKHQWKEYDDRHRTGPS